MLSKYSAIVNAFLVISAHATQTNIRRGSGVSLNASCPNDNGELYTDTDGFTYELACDSNYNSSPNDLFGPFLSNFTDCLQFCSDYNLGGPDYPCTSISMDKSDALADGTRFCGLRTGQANETVPDPTYDAALLQTEPLLLPPIAYRDHPICPQDDRKFFTDDTGTTYMILCDFDFTTYNTAIQPQNLSTYDECASYCTQLQGQGCFGFQYNGTLCTPIDGFVDAIPGIGPAGLFISGPAPCPVTSTTTNLTLKEGGTYYQSTLSLSDAHNILNVTNQTDACQCVEQCAHYNRVGNGTDSTLCLGVEYDTQALSNNCILKPY